MVEVTRPLFRITKNMPVFNVGMATSLEGAVNSKKWNGDKWCWRISGVEGANKFENGVAFVEVSLDIMYRAETWVTSLLDAGFYSLDRRHPPNDPDGALIDIWTRMRCPVGGDGPFPLDGKGKKLEPDKPAVFVKGLTSNYRLADFAKILSGFL